MKKTLKALLLCLFLCIGVLSLPIGALAEEGEGEVKDIVELVELYKEGEPLESGDVISLGDQFELKYTLNELYLNYGDDAEDGNDNYIKKGDKIILPKFPKILTDYEKNITMDIDNLSDPLGVVTLDEEGNVLLEVTNESEGEHLTNVTFGIACKLDDDQIGDNEEYSIELPNNDTPVKVKIKENEKPEDPGPIIVDPPLKDKMKLSKTASETIERDGDDAILSWTITLDNMGYDFSNFVLYDKFKSDSKTDMKLITDSIEVTKDGSDITSDTSVDTTPGTADYNGSATGYDFAIRLGDISGESKYVVTYKSRLKDYDTYLKQNHSSVPRNETWFEFGDEEHKTYSDLVKTNGKLIGKPGIVKNFTNYDAANHKITWKIEANTSKQPLTNVNIREVIGEGQELVEITNATLEGEDYDISDKYAGDPDTKIDGIDKYGEYVITLGDDLKNKTLTFYVVTQLKESEMDFYSGNSKKVYKNKVVMNSVEMANVIDEVEKTCESKVLTKEIVGKYNYATHEFKYRIVANDNKMQMSEISVKDGLNESGLELIIATDKPIKMNGVELQKDTGVRPYYTYSDGILTVYPEDAEAGEDDSRKEITFTARVKDDTYLDNIAASSINISNNATIKTKEYPETTVNSDKAKKTINNSMVTKTGAATKDKKTAEYSIVINNSKQVLPNGVKIIDTLGASFELDEESVKLYMGSINPDTGAVTVAKDENNAEIEATGYKTNTSGGSGEKTQLEVTLPDNSDRNCYILKYKALPLYPGNNDFSNNAQMQGFGGDATLASGVSLSKSSFNTGTSSNSVVFTITKLDEEDETPLEGAVFSITDEDENEVLRLTTKANGQAKSIGKLKPNTVYFAKEVTAPEGYDVNEESFRFVTNTNKVNLNFTNKKTKAQEPDVPNPGNDDDNKDDNKNGNNSGSNNSGNNSDNKNGNSSDNGSGGPSNGSDSKNSGGSSDKHHSSDDHHDNNGGNNNSDSNANNAAANTNANTNAAANKNAANANANNGNKPKIIVKAPSEYDDLLLSDEEIKAKGYEVVDGATIEGGDPNYEYIIGPNGEVLGARKKAIAGAKLAKTGGFVGTLVSYIIGGVAVIIGTVLLVINPKKAHNRKRR
ncbi:hypothetical protein D6856_01825 [Butyrivibrio sp. XB500-5]|uniref:prealbumin-like fold domain-containing protein n=1 Tax=Butyrivibrio sp. XB500-5 TaxID=2364880 RepID=UPI000EA97F40|nr:SpaA isopeptide-forming pilin-related protein [Butyrivibrio sp. XB500-5]RKM62886.1 hypothetical protein D6856_01825 [Butyrivibrio sp. XB500-5]